MAPPKKSEKGIYPPNNEGAPLRIFLTLSLTKHVRERIDTFSMPVRGTATNWRSMKYGQLIQIYNRFEVHVCIAKLNSNFNRDKHSQLFRPPAHPPLKIVNILIHPKIIVVQLNQYVGLEHNVSLSQVTAVAVTLQIDKCNPPKDTVYLSCY